MKTVYRLLKGEVQSAILDLHDNLYYIKGNRLYKLTSGGEEMELLNTNNRKLVDLGSDLQGNVFVASHGYMDVLLAGQQELSVLAEEYRAKVVQVKVNLLGQVFVLLDLGDDAGLTGYQLTVEGAMKLDDVDAPFAVDSNGTWYSSSMLASSVHGDASAALAIMPVNSMAVDAADQRLYFGAEDGLYEASVGSCVAVRLEDGDIPHVTKVETRPDDSIFFVSADPEMAGVYVISDNPDLGHRYHYMLSRV